MARQFSIGPALVAAAALVVAGVSPARAQRPDPQVPRAIDATAPGEIHTIKVAGKRIGPAEIESVLVAHGAVSEAAAIGVPDEMKGEALVCFCVPNPGHERTEALGETLRSRIACALGKPLAPREVHFVRDLPRTRNAKIMRRVIRAAYLGLDPGDVSSLENPSAIDEIRAMRGVPRVASRTGGA